MKERPQTVFDDQPRQKTIGCSGSAPPFPAIHLMRSGEHVIVAVEYEGKWFEVIREHHEGGFSHIVEPSGIWCAIQRAKK